MVEKLFNVKLAVVASVLALHAEFGTVPALLLLGAALAAASGVSLHRWIRRRVVRRERAAAQAAVQDDLRALVDDAGGLYDQCLAAEADRGLRMLDQWRRTHSP